MVGRPGDLLRPNAVSPLTLALGVVVGTAAVEFEVLWDALGLLNTVVLLSACAC